MIARTFFAATFAVAALSTTSGIAFARDYISIAGSSTVLPFATIVAEQLGKNPSIKTPVVESGGSSVGKKVSVMVSGQSSLISGTLHHV